MFLEAGVIMSLRILIVKDTFFSKITSQSYSFVDIGPP